MMDANQLAEIEARAKAATEGPWKRATPNTHVYCAQDDAGIEWEIVNGGSLPDHEFVAHARQDIPDLIAYAEELEEKIHQIRNWANAYPETVFIEPDLEKTRQVLEAAGISVAGLHGTWGRHITEGIRGILNG